MPQQIGQGLGGIVTEAAKGAVQAGKDIVGEVAEQVVGSSGQGQKQANQPQTPEDAQKAHQKKAADTARYKQVMAELEQYRERRKRQEAQIESEKTEQEQARKQQEEANKKQEKESFAQQLLRRVSGQSHGETSKIKE